MTAYPEKRTDGEWAGRAPGHGLGGAASRHDPPATAPGRTWRVVSEDLCDGDEEVDRGHGVFEEWVPEAMRSPVCGGSDPIAAPRPPGVPLDVLRPPGHDDPAEQPGCAHCRRRPRPAKKSIAMPQPDPTLLAAPPPVRGRAARAPQAGGDPAAAFRAASQDAASPPPNAAAILRFPSHPPPHRSPAAGRESLASDLLQLAELWPALSPRVRSTILALAEAAGRR